MPAPPPDPHRLRDRAAGLRGAARTLDHAALHAVPGRAGVETWIGPTADRFADDLRRATVDLDHAADQLRDAARRLETQAAVLEAAARVTALGGPR